MPAVLEAISSAMRRKQRENEEALFAELQSLVRDAAAGKEICEDAAETGSGLLEVLKIPGAEFTEMVATQKKREVDAKLHNQLPELRIAARQVEAEMRAAKEAIETFLRRERPRLAALDEKNNAIGAQLSAAEFASARLYNSYRNPVVQQQERDLSAQVQAKQGQIAAQRERIKEQCEQPLANIITELREQLAHAKECQEAALPRDPRNVSIIAQLAAGKRGTEERLERETKILNGLMAEEAYLQSELQALALRHYEV